MSKECRLINAYEFPREYINDLEKGLFSVGCFSEVFNAGKGESDIEKRLKKKAENMGADVIMINTKRKFLFARCKVAGVYYIKRN